MKQLYFLSHLPDLNFYAKFNMKALNLVSCLGERSGIKFHHTLERRITCCVMLCSQYFTALRKSEWPVTYESSFCLPLFLSKKISCLSLLLEDLSCWVLLCLWIGFGFFTVTSFDISSTMLCIFFLILGWNYITCS